MVFIGNPPPVNAPQQGNGSASPVQ
jgi:hypothetical protein